MPPNRRNHQQHNGAGHGHGGAGAGNNQVKPIKCCVPSECLRPNQGIFLEDLGTADLEVVKVVCNNDHCGQSQYMHRECFESWEQTVLTYLRSCGRARSWSEKQRLQNLWTKRGYDLAFKACSCKCGKGHLRKDLDWIPPTRPAVGGGNGGAAAAAAAAAAPAANEANANNNGVAAAAPAAPAAGAAAAAAVPVPAGGKKKKNKTKEPKPTLAISAPVPHPNNNHLNNNNHHPTPGTSASAIRQQQQQEPKQHSQHHPHIGSLGASLSSHSNSVDLGLGTSVSSTASTSSMLANRPRVNSLSSTGSAASSSGVSGSPPSPGAQFGSPVANPGLFRYRKNSLVTERTRHNSGSMFSRRLDFSSFNALPRHKLNSYHIKMEDEHNDETRTFVMNTLLQAKTNRISCVLCQMNLMIFDRYPLIDGTFFLTPRQHTKACLQAEMPNGRVQYLSAVCMSCLEGWSVNLYCRCCKSKWDGSSLILGSIYTYDIFAAMPCCRDRFSCTNCRVPVIPLDQRPNFFSEYSQSSRCPNCGLADYHLAKPLPMIFDKISNVS